MDRAALQEGKEQTTMLGRQSSIYSLTLDEFQHTLSESGKNFGSMNMDEFLNSIWTAEENQAQPPPSIPLQQTSTAKGIITQSSLPRQPSLTIPEPLCRKTVDQVWSEIHKDPHVQNPNNTAHKQATFGEMTLEDFLVRAGVVREQAHHPPPFGIFQNNNHHPSVMAVGVAASASNYQSGVGEGQGGYAAGGGMKSRGYGGRLGNGSSGGGFGLGMGSPVSPLSDGMGANQVDSGNQYGMEGMRGGGGRKRNMDGPVEKVVERRQRRMIKNRESAARSRARKQAYTVELEAELNQLKEENLHLKQALAELEMKRKQQYYEDEEARQAELQSKSYKAREKLRAMRRSLSCPN